MKGSLLLLVTFIIGIHAIGARTVLQFRVGCTFDAFEQIVLAESNFGTIRLESNGPYIDSFLTVEGDGIVEIGDGSLFGPAVGASNGCINVTDNILQFNGGSFGTTLTVRFAEQNCLEADSVVVCRTEAANTDLRPGLDKVEFWSAKKLDSISDEFISGLVNTTVIDLSDVGLSGTIPSSLMALEKLEMLDLRGNEFYGCVPEGKRNILRPNRNALKTLIAGDGRVFVDNDGSEEPIARCSKIEAGFSMVPRSVENQTLFDMIQNPVSCNLSNIPGIDGDTIVLVNGTLCGDEGTTSVFIHSLGASGVILVTESPASITVPNMTSELIVCSVPANPWETSSVPSGTISLFVNYEKVDRRERVSVLQQVGTQFCGNMTYCVGDESKLRTSLCSQCELLLEKIGPGPILAYYVVLSCVMIPMLLAGLFTWSRKSLNAVTRKSLKLLLLFVILLGSISGVDDGNEFHFNDETYFYTVLLPLEGMSMQPYTLHKYLFCTRNSGWFAAGGATLLGIPGLVLFAFIIQCSTPSRTWGLLSSADRRDMKEKDHLQMRLLYTGAWIFAPLCCLVGHDVSGNESLTVSVEVKFLYFGVLGFALLCLLYVSFLTNSLNFGFGTLPGEAENQRQGYQAERLLPIELVKPMLTDDSQFVFLMMLVFFMFLVLFFNDNAMRLAMTVLPALVVVFDVVGNLIAKKCGSCVTLANPVGMFTRIMICVFAIQGNGIDLNKYPLYVVILLLYVPYVVLIGAIVVYHRLKLPANGEAVDVDESKQIPQSSILSSVELRESLLDLCRQLRDSTQKYRWGAGLLFSSIGLNMILLVAGGVTLGIIQALYTEEQTYFVGLIILIVMVLFERGRRSITKENGFVVSRFGKDKIKLVNTKELLQFVCEFYQKHKRIPPMNEVNVQVKWVGSRKGNFTFISHRWFDGSKKQPDSPDGALTRGICACIINHEYAKKKSDSESLSIRDIAVMVTGLFSKRYTYKDLGYTQWSKELMENVDFMIKTDWIWVDTHCVDQTSPDTITQDIQNIPNVLLQAGDAMAFTHDLKGYQRSFWCGVEAAFLNHYYYMKSRELNRLQELSILNLEAFRGGSVVVNLGSTFVTSITAFTFENVQKISDVETLINALASPLQMGSKNDRLGLVRRKILRLLADVYNVLAVVSDQSKEDQSIPNMPLFKRSALNPAFPQLLGEIPSKSSSSIGHIQL